MTQETKTRKKTGMTKADLETQLAQMQEQMSQLKSALDQERTARQEAEEKAKKSGRQSKGFAGRVQHQLDSLNGKDELPSRLAHLKCLLAEPSLTDSQVVEKSKTDTKPTSAGSARQWAAQTVAVLRHMGLLNVTKCQSAGLIPKDE